MDCESVKVVCSIMSAPMSYLEAWHSLTHCQIVWRLERCQVLLHMERKACRGFALPGCDAKSLNYLDQCKRLCHPIWSVPGTGCPRQGASMRCRPPNAVQGISPHFAACHVRRSLTVLLPTKSTPSMSSLRSQTSSVCPSDTWKMSLILQSQDVFH